MWLGKEGSFPDLTMAMSSGCVCAVEKGELPMSTGSHSYTNSSRQCTHLEDEAAETPDV